jgi:hypothetical protein
MLDPAKRDQTKVHGETKGNDEKPYPNRKVGMRREKENLVLCLIYRLGSYVS